MLLVTGETQKSATKESSGPWDLTTLNLAVAMVSGMSSVRVLEMPTSFMSEQEVEDANRLCPDGRVDLEECAQLPAVKAAIRIANQEREPAAVKEVTAIQYEKNLITIQFRV